MPLTCSPTTLPGYEDITQPVEISSSFVEGVNGQTTTQGEFWLIGPHGVIAPPRDIGGGFGIHLPDGGLPDGTTGPPGYPGGPVGGTDAAPDDPPQPYPEDPNKPDDKQTVTDQDQKSNFDSTTSIKASTSIDTPSTTISSSSTSSSSPSSSVSGAQYSIIAVSGAPQAQIDGLL